MKTEFTDTLIECFEELTNKDTDYPCLSDELIESIGIGGRYPKDKEHILFHI